MSSPRVSVICIFLDAERFLSEAIESVLDQHYRDFDLLLIDDGSTDSSTAIAREFAARFPKRIIYLDHEGHANLGMSAARNLGLSRASGEFVAFIDSDDAWIPQKLGEQVEILERNSQAAMVCGTVNYWESWAGGEDRLIPTGSIADRLSSPPSTLLHLYPLGAEHAPCPSDVLVRRVAIDRVGRFEEQFTGLYEDIAFFAKISAFFPVWFSARSWTFYRQHPASSSAGRTARHYREVRGAFLRWFEGYVSAANVPGEREVLRAIRRAQRELSFPVLAGIRRRLRKLHRDPAR